MAGHLKRTRRTRSGNGGSKTVTTNHGDFKEVRPRRVSFEVENAENGGFAITTRENLPNGSKSRLFIAKNKTEKNKIIDRITKDSRVQ